jgi:hydrogenase expression/formation protein HypC
LIDLHKRLFSRERGGGEEEEDGEGGGAVEGGPGEGKPAAAGFAARLPGAAASGRAYTLDPRRRCAREEILLSCGAPAAQAWIPRPRREVVRMCLAIPVRLVSIEGDEARGTLGAAEIRVGLALVPEAKAGDYVLVHAGFALEVISEEEARKTFEIVRDLAEAGDAP